MWFEQRQTSFWLVLEGEIDLATIAQFWNALALLNGDALIDCTELEFIGACGISALALLASRVDSVTLSGASPFVWRLLEICQVKTMFLGEIERWQNGDRAAS